MRKMSKLRSLTMMMIPLILCVSLLIGFTLAWFTVEVKNTDNNIEAGTMELAVLKYDNAKSAYQDIGKQKLFDDRYWEPGTTQIAYLAVKNVGSLNLAYNVKLNVEEGAIALSEVMEYAIISPMSKSDNAAFSNWSAVTAYEGVKTGNLAKGELNIATDSALRIGDTKYFMLAVHMKDDAPSAYQSGWLELDLEVTAKQIAGESDSFGSTYDTGSDYKNGATVSALWENLIKGGTYDFEDGMDKRMKSLKGTVEVVDEFTRPESTKVLKVGADSRAQFNQQSSTAELTAGYYKLTGFVKLGNADPSKVSFTIWAYKNIIDGSNIVTPVLSDCILVDADESGWAYFEMIFDHGENYSLLQFNITNGDTENPIYFDDFRYLKYVGTEDIPGYKPEGLTPSEPGSLWQPYARLDFEGSKFPMVAADEKHAVGGLGVPGHNDSAQSLRLDGTEQAKYSKSASLAAGWYRVRGYVKLDGAKPENVQVTVWGYTGTKEGNARTKNMAEAVIGEADANGWSFFEIIFDHKVDYTLIQFITRNYGSTTVYFDDIEYEKYTGTGTPGASQAPVYPSTGNPQTPTVTWNVLTELDFETGTLEDSYVTPWNDKTNSISLATKVGFNSSKSLQVDNTARAKFYQQGVALTAGWYRISGYVQLGGADASKVSVQPWVKKADGKTNDATAYTLDKCIVGQADANGWSYFELYIQQLAAQPTYQFVFNNNSGSGVTVYFDNIKFEKYNKVGKPPMAPEPEVTPPVIVPPTVEPGTPTETWTNYANLNFETGTLADSYVSQWNDTTNSFALATTVGHNSSKSLQLDNTARAKFYQAGVTLPAGWYRLSGYVKLNGADASKVNVQPWVKQADGKTNDTTTYSLASCIVGHPDADGWSYFELDILQLATQPTFQFVFNNNNGSGKTVYFDNVTYAKYNGEGQPVPTEPPVVEIPLWQDWTVLDFETGTLEENYVTAWSATTNSIDLATTVGYNSSKSLQVDNTARAKYYQAGITLPAGWYRISGYVKLNGADPSKVSIQPWVKQADGKTNDTKSYTLNGCIIGQADENGWSYFELDIQQLASQPAFQFVFNNNNGSGTTVYFDNIKYAGYQGNGQPESTEPPEEENPLWENMVTLDFETGTLDENYVLKYNDATNYFSLATTAGYNSSKSVQVDNGGRAKYYKAGATLQAGWYRISGYVKLNGADPSKVSVSSWEKKVESGNNPASYALSSCIIGEADANGWSYFEIYTEHKATQPTFQFVFNNNANSGKTVYFDNVKYDMYLGEGQPQATQPAIS